MECLRSGLHGRAFVGVRLPPRGRRQQRRQLGRVAARAIRAPSGLKIDRMVKRQRTMSAVWQRRARLFDSDDYFESEDERILPPSDGPKPRVGRGKGSSKRSNSFKSGTDGHDVSGDDSVFGFLNEADKDAPTSWYHRALWLWERPVMKIGRLTVLFAQLPTALTFLASQIGLLAGQVTLPMLPPLLLGGGILLRSIWINAGHLFPRVCLTVFLLWGIWLMNSLIFRTVGYLTDQEIVGRSAAHAIMNWTEGVTLVIAGLVILSLFGVNISGLLLPAGICMALAAKDLAHNFLAGMVLFLAHPFGVGDEVSVKPVNDGSQTGRDSWYDGICERVDLRYTVLRKGKYRLHVPNSSFITKEFLVLDKEYQSAQSIPKKHKAPEEGRTIKISIGDQKDTADVNVNGGHVDLDDLPSDVDYPAGELHLGDLTDYLTDF